MSTRITSIALAALLLGFAPGSSLANRLLAPQGGAVHALIVGVNDYPNLGGQSLRGARPDAEDLASVLKNEGVTDLTVLLDRDVTRARFVTEMNRLIAQSKSGDLVWLSYSGHGTQVPEYDNWKGYNSKPANEEIVLSGFGFKGAALNEAVVNVEVRAWLARLDAKGVDTIVLWDSCFGGGMRGMEPGSGEIQVRRAQRPADADAMTHFPSIAMTAAEARAEVTTMPHVTFLAGATDDSVVPEMSGVDTAHPSVPRGALSYYVARALEGRLKSGPITRVEMFKYLKQNVNQATEKRQSIEVSPQGKGDVSISGRDVFVIANDGGDNPALSTTPNPNPTPPAVPTSIAPIRLAIVNGSPDAFATIEKHSTPLELVADRDQADLVWDVGAQKAFAHSDKLMDGVDGSLIGANADRVRALSRLREVAAQRPLEIGLKSGGDVLTPGNVAQVEVSGPENAKLVVFNVAADATLQMEYPAAPDANAACPQEQATGWSCSLEVGAPFGVDTLVAVATSRDATSLLDWLRKHVNHRDASELPDIIAKILQDDTTARVGFTTVVTRAKAY